MFYLTFFWAKFERKAEFDKKGVADICFDTWLQLLELIGKAWVLPRAIGLLQSCVKTNVRYSLHTRRQFEMSRLYSNAGTG